MFKYVLRDVTAMLRYLPYGLVVGIVVALLLSVVNDWRIRRQKKPFSVLATTSFFMYVVIMLCITFLSRESGGSSVFDFELFSTWGINNRNNAYLIENILLFIPYGFVCAWAVFGKKGSFFYTLLGALTSVGIEFLQFFSGRGFFQIDDILTNTLGTVIGYLFYRIIFRKK